MYAGTCRWLELVAELDRRGELVTCTCAEWLAWRCGLTPRTAREHVRIARRLVELPAIREAFSRGEISFAKVRALTRIADGESEAELLELALGVTAAQLDRIVRAYRRVTTEQAEAVQEAAYFDWHWDDDGSLVVEGRLAPEDGAVLVKALDAARDALWARGRGSAEPRPANAEVFAAVGELALSRTTDRSGGERHQVVVHVDQPALADTGPGGCELADGPAIAAETARRIACDSSVVRVAERDGRVLSVGRKTRSIPAALRRALRRRDGGCRFPGCENRRFVDAHHVRHWAHGGETKLENLLLLCRRHHRLLHEGGYSIERRSNDEFLFRDRYGRAVPAVPRPPPGRLEALLEIDADEYRSGAGDRLDLNLAVESLLVRDALPDASDEARDVSAFVSNP
jgi:Domain of unknown function (DUF222)/HNH endonuclease